MWCNEDGYIVDDGTVFCFNDNDFTICCAERNLNWFEDTAIGYDVTVEDISQSIAALAFQGPLSCKILHKLGAKGIENLKPFDFENFQLNNKEVMISRTGFSIRESTRLPRYSNTADFFVAKTIATMVRPIIVCWKPCSPETDLLLLATFPVSKSPTLQYCCCGHQWPGPSFLGVPLASCRALPIPRQFVPNPAT